MNINVFNIHQLKKRISESDSNNIIPPSRVIIVIVVEFPILKVVSFK